MKTRILTALILIPLLVILLLSPSTVIAGAVIVVSLLALWEFYKATGLFESTGKKLLCMVGFAAGIVIPLAKYIPDEYFPSLLYLAMLALFAVMLIKHGEVKAADAATVIFSIIYIPYFLTNILYVRELENGIFYIWLIFIGAFLTDSGAYFAGVFLGRHKLCPQISPKKTVEGAVGGIIACILFYAVYGLILSGVFSLDISFVRLCALGLTVSVISQMGDLTASVIKRQHGIKDYGNLFPGHGGILDRCDSVILVAPAVFLFLKNIGI